MIYLGYKKRTAVMPSVFCIPFPLQITHLCDFKRKISDQSLLIFLYLYDIILVLHKILQSNTISIA